MPEKTEPLATMLGGFQVNRVYIVHDLEPGQMVPSRYLIGWQIGWSKDKMAMIGRDKLHLLVGLLEADKTETERLEKLRRQR